MENGLKRKGIKEKKQKKINKEKGGGGKEYTMHIVYHQQLFKKNRHSMPGQ